MSLATVGSFTQTSASRSGTRPESPIGGQQHDVGDLEHACCNEWERFESFSYLYFVLGLEKQTSARHIAALPDLTDEPFGIKRSGTLRLGLEPGLKLLVGKLLRFAAR